MALEPLAKNSGAVRGDNRGWRRKTDRARATPDAGSMPWTNVPDDLTSLIQSPVGAVIGHAEDARLGRRG